MSRRAPSRIIAALVLLFVTWMAPSRVVAGPDADSRGIEASIDQVAGYIVRALDTVLFYRLFETHGSTTLAVPARTADAVAPMVDELEAVGLGAEEASFVLRVPESVPTQEAEQLQRTLAARYLQVPVRGGRSFQVVRAADEDGTTLTGKQGGMPIIVLWLSLGAVFFTVRMGFVNLRGFRHAVKVVRGRFDNPADAGEVTHFQALASALSATVGLGNIAGVAIAVAIGGPGAIFWMILAGFLGMSSKFVECTLGQKYRMVGADGRVNGGPMFYLSRGLAELRLPRLGKALSVIFAIFCIGGSLGGGNTFQVNQSLGILRDQIPFLDAHAWVYGLAMTVLTGVVILGGIRRIAATAEKIVPLMCGIYVLASLAILAMHITEVPGVFASIVGEAFSPAAGFGGIAGVMVTGTRRAVFSNEAGVGSASIAHSAAKTEYPVREGMVSLLEPFIDTIVVCTMTGLVIVITGAYSDPANAELIASSNGAALTSRAMGGEIAWFPVVLSAAVFLFAYSTMISWSYYGERCTVYLLGQRWSNPYKVLFLVFVMLGSIITAENILNFGDLMILSMGVPNILGLFLLSSNVRRDLDTYLRELESGRMKEFRK